MKTSRSIIPTTAEILQLFAEIKRSGSFFGAKFVKKDGSVRIMNCRAGVKKHLKGGTLKFNPFEKGLLVVFDTHKKEYRMVNLNTLLEIHFGGVRYVFVNNLINMIGQNQNYS